jgi:hypothetical protein
MTNKPDFQYFITDNEGRSFFRRPNGTVGVTPAYTPLKSTPDGWQEVSIKFGRSEQKAGVYRAYTVPIKAVEDGGLILKHIYYTYGVNFKCYLVIAKFNRTTDIYDPYFISAIDLTKFLDANYGATVTVLEGGLVKLIKANGNTSYEFPLDVPEAVTLVHDGIELVGNRRYLANNGGSVDLRRSHVAGLIELEGEGNDFTFGSKGTTRTDITDNDGPSIAATGQWFLQASVTGNVKFTFDLNIRVTRTNEAPAPSPAVDLFVQLHVQQGNTIVSATTVYSVSGITNVYGPNILLGKLHTIAGTFTVNVPAGAQVYLVTTVGPIDSVLGDVNSLIDYVSNESNFLAVEFLSRYPRSRMKVLRPEYVFKKLIEKISGGLFGAESVVLRDQLKDFVITSGDGVRGLEGAVLKTSLNDFLKSYDSSFALDMGVSDTLAIIEPLKYFYADNYLIDLSAVGDVNNLQISAAEQYFFTEIHVGSPTDTYDDVNGRNEPNTTFRFTTPFKGTDNILDKVSVYNKDAYGIEIQRINLSGKLTTDSESDNKVYMINIAPVSFTGSMVFSALDTTYFINVLTRFESVFPGSLITITNSVSNNGTYTVVAVNQFGTTTEIIVAEPVVAEAGTNVTITSNEAALNRPEFDAISGLISPDTMYNLLLSPKRALLAHGPFIRSGLDLEDANALVFQRADKNDKMVTTLDGVTIAEKADVPIGSLGAKLFRPHLFKFDTQVPLNLVQIMELSPSVKYGKVKFSWRGNVYYGYILDAGQVPQLNPAQSWTLLCAPETNLLPLISEV